MKYEGTNLSVLGSCYSIAISDKVRYGRVALFKLYSLYADTYVNKNSRSSQKSPAVRRFPENTIRFMLGLWLLITCAPHGDGVCLGP